MSTGELFFLVLVGFEAVFLVGFRLVAKQQRMLMPVPDLMRADDAEREPVDPDAPTRAAWDFFDVRGLLPSWMRGVRDPYFQERLQADRSMGKPPTRFFLIVLFLVAVDGFLGAALLVPTSLGMTEHRFVPSETQLHVLTLGGTATPSDCSNAFSDDGSGPVAQITSADADEDFSIPIGGSVDVLGDVEYSSDAPFCYDANGDYAAERPGVASLYYFDSQAHVSVVEVTGVRSTHASTTLRSVSLVVGIFAALGLVVALRSLRRRCPVAGSPG